MARGKKITAVRITPIGIFTMSSDGLKLYIEEDDFVKDIENGKYRLPSDVFEDFNRQVEVYNNEKDQK